MYAELDRSKTIRCECGKRLGYATFARVDDTYSRAHLRFDTGIEYRAIIGGTSIATHVAECPSCDETVSIVDRQLVSTRLYDSGWIARTLQGNKAILRAASSVVQRSTVRCTTLAISRTQTFR